MSRKGLLIVIVLFVVAFLLLALVRRGYRELEEVRSSTKGRVGDQGGPRILDKPGR